MTFLDCGSGPNFPILHSELPFLFDGPFHERRLGSIITKLGGLKPCLRVTKPFELLDQWTMFGGLKSFLGAKKPFGLPGQGKYSTN